MPNYDSHPGVQMVREKRAGREMVLRQMRGFAAQFPQMPASEWRSDKLDDLIRHVSPNLPGMHRGEVLRDLVADGLLEVTRQTNPKFYRLSEKGEA